MKATADFNTIAPDEEQEIAVDFSGYLSAGDSVATALAWNSTVADWSPAGDPTPGARKVGPTSLTGSVVAQTIAGCVPGVIYIQEAVVMTLFGETLSIWAYLPCASVGQG